MSRNSNQSPATQDEAQAVARSIQKPGQTKEQTRLIAQGIAKGIETYKRQQSAKSRERDKARKRQLKEARQGQSLQETGGQPDSASPASRQALALRFSVCLLLAVSLAAWMPILLGWTVIVGPWTLPGALLPAAGAVFAGAAIACFHLSATPES